MRSHAVEGQAEVHLTDGTLVAEAEGVLVAISEEERVRVEEILPFWQVVLDQA